MCFQLCIRKQPHDTSNDNDSEKGYRKKTSKKDDFDLDALPHVESLMFPLRFPPKKEEKRIRPSHVDDIEVDRVVDAVNVLHFSSRPHHVHKHWVEKISVKNEKVYWCNIDTGELSWDEPNHDRHHENKKDTQ